MSNPRVPAAPGPAPGIQLSPAELEAVVSVAEAAAGAGDLESFGRIVAQGLYDLMPSVSTAYTELNLPAKRAFAAIVPEPPTEWWGPARAIFEANVDQHPVLRHVRTTGSTNAITWDDVPGVEDFRSTTLYKEYYQPLGIDSQLLAGLPAPEGIYVAIGVNRGSEGFTAKERLMLDLLRIQLSPVYRMIELSGERKALHSALSSEGWAIVLVGESGEVTDTTFDDPEFAAPGSLLPEPLLTHFLDLVRELTPWTGAPPAGFQPVSFRWATGSGDDPVSAVVLLNPIPPHAVLLRSGRVVSPDMLEGLGLTKRQREVAAALVDGGGNKVIARQLGISPDTVRKHLEAIYQTLEVSSRAGAVSRLASFVRSSADSE